MSWNKFKAQVSQDIININLSYFWFIRLFHYYYILSCFESQLKSTSKSLMTYPLLINPFLKAYTHTYTHREKETHTYRDTHTHTPTIIKHDHPRTPLFHITYIKNSWCWYLSVIEIYILYVVVCYCIKGSWLLHLPLILLLLLLPTHRLCRLPWSGHAKPHVYDRCLLDHLVLREQWSMLILVPARPMVPTGRN